jgi:hypothetical protein
VNPHALDSVRASEINMAQQRVAHAIAKFVLTRVPLHVHMSCAQTPHASANESGTCVYAGLRPRMQVCWPVLPVSDLTDFGVCIGTR